MIKKIVGWLLANVLYELGRFTSLFLHKWEGLYRVYSWLMYKSIQINDWAGLDVWVPKDED